MNSLVGHVRLVRQYKPTTCGQACIAMLTDVSEWKACAAVWKWGITTIDDLVPALRALGAGKLRVRRDRLVPLARVRRFVPCGLVYVSPVDGTRHGHWVVWVGDAYLCPTHGEMEPEAALAFWAKHGAAPESILPVEVLGVS